MFATEEAPPYITCRRPTLPADWPFSAHRTQHTRDVIAIHGVTRTVGEPSAPTASIRRRKPAVKFRCDGGTRSFRFSGDSGDAIRKQCLPYQQALLDGLAHVPFPEECANMLEYDPFRHRKRYPSDLTDEQWALVAPLIPPAKQSQHGGRPREVDMREVLNTLLYLHRSGCQWAISPHDLLPKSTVYDYFAQWRDDGTWTRLVNALRGAQPRGRRARTRPQCCLHR